MNIRAKLQMRNFKKSHLDLLGAVNVNKPSESVTDLLKKYATSNVLKLFWMFVLGSGGMLFLFYYWWLRYFPVSFDLASSSALLAAISITGLGLFIALSFYAIAPGWFWREMVCKDKELATILRPEDSKHFQISTVLFFSAPIAIAIGFALVYFVNEWRCYQIVPIIGALFLLVFWTFRWMEKGIPWWPSFKLLGAVAINCLVFSWLFVMMAWFSTSGSQENSVAAFFLVLGVSVVGNHFVASLGNKKTLWIYALFAVVLFIAPSLLTKNFFQTSRATMRFFKFGNIENVQLILDQQGGLIARQFIDPIASSVSVASSVPSAEAGGKIGAEKKTDRLYLTEGCLVKSITILSRLGNEYYLEVKLPDKQKNEQDKNSLKATEEEHRFIIPSSHVLSWRVHGDDKGAPTSLMCAVTELEHKAPPAVKKTVHSRYSKVTCASVCSDARTDNKIFPSATEPNINTER